MKTYTLYDLCKETNLARIREWYVKVGDSVSIGDKLAELDSMKVNIEIKSPFSGEIMKIFAKDGTEIQSDTILLKIRYPL